MNLWPNQQRALESVSSAIAAGDRKICVTSPTGGGKTMIMFRRILDSSIPTALYTDRRMLFKQISEGLELHGIEHGKRAAGHDPRLLDDMQLCMVGTEASRSLKGKREIHRARQVIIDEAHKNAADTMTAIVGEHRKLEPDLVLLGFTATPLGIGHLYETLVVAGTNSEMRSYGALLPAYHYGPDEPDTKWIGRIIVGEGECGLPNNKRMEFAHRVFGRVVENYRTLNPEQKPALLFAPGVKESKWFCQALNDDGISSAHIDGECVVLDGIERPNDDEAKDELAERSKSGDIKIVCNRFVLREGIDWPWIYHGILATVFGSLTSYIQAGGRLLRAHPSMDSVIVQDHGGNWWRHGSLNEDREWDLSYTDRIAAGLREQRIRQKKEPEPIVCPKCNACRLKGPKCFQCGYQHTGGTRIVLQRDGSLREMRGDIFRARRILNESQQLQQEWLSRVRAIRKSQKPTVQGMTFSQLEAVFAKDHNWGYPPRTLQGMPINEADWFRPIKDVPDSQLTRKQYSKVEAPW